MADQSPPDIGIVGAGALGIDLAIFARRHGARVVLVDRGMSELGDHSQGAVRAAALAASAARAAAIRDPDMSVGSDEPKIVYKALAERVARLAEERSVKTSADRLKALGIEVVKGPTQFQDARSVSVGDLAVRPRHIVLAVGGRPVVPSIDGLADIPYFTPDSIYENQRRLTHLLVIGGDAVALELAQAHRRLGGAVTLVPQGPLLAGFDEEAVRILVALLRREGVEILEGASVTKVHSRAQGTGITVLGPDGGDISLDVSHVLVSCGRSADVEALGLEKARIKAVSGSGTLADGPLGQTANRSVRVVGHAAGIGEWSQARGQGRAVIDALLMTGRNKPAHDAPRMVMTDPPLAQFGANAGTRQSRGLQLLRANFAENDKAAVDGHKEGLGKVWVDAGGRIRGAAVIGSHAGELTALLLIAQENGIGLGKLAGLALPAPSIAEIVVALAENFADGQPVAGEHRRRIALRRLLPW